MIKWCYILILENIMNEEKMEIKMIDKNFVAKHVKEALDKNDLHFLKEVLFVHDNELWIKEVYKELHKKAAQLYEVMDKDYLELYVLSTILQPIYKNSESFAPNVQVGYHYEETKNALLRALNIVENRLGDSDIESVFSYVIGKDGSAFLNDKDVVLRVASMGNVKFLIGDNLINDKDFVLSFIEKTNLKNFEKLEFVWKNDVDVMLALTKKFGFPSLEYHSNEIYKNDKFYEEILDIAGKENWLDPNHDFIKKRYCASLFVNNIGKAFLKSEKCKMVDMFKYSNQQVSQLVNGLVILRNENLMKEDLENINGAVNARKRNVHKF